MSDLPEDDTPDPTLPAPTPAFPRYIEPAA